MALLAIVALGLIAPFALIFGAVGYLFALPVLYGVKAAQPHWQRLPQRTRRRIVRALIWGTSGLAWGWLLRHGGI